MFKSMTFYYMTFFQCFIIILQLTQMTSFFRSDIVGLDDVKNKLKESIIYPALRPEVYKTFGVDPAKVSFTGDTANRFYSGILLLIRGYATFSGM